MNGIPMMSSIDKTIRYRSVVPLENRTKEELFEGLDKILRNYNNGAGFDIGTISSDHEFVALLEDLKDELDITLNSCPAGEHEPVAERNNRVIGEQIRAVYHCLPLKKSPKLCGNIWQWNVPRS